MQKQYCVYILANTSNTVLYTGVTGNLWQRVEQHKNKQVCFFTSFKNREIEGFTKKYNVWKLVYFEAYEEVKTAIKREKQIKNLLRRKKEDLIRSINPDFEEIDISKRFILL